MQSKTYIINGRPYIQQPLVLGQIMQLIDLSEGIVLQSFTVEGIIKALGPKLSMAAAIVLTPEGTELKDKDLLALEAEFFSRLDLKTALEVAEDFLSFNPLSSASDRIKGMIMDLIMTILMTLERRVSGSVSDGSSKNSVTEISQDATGSSGT